MPAAAPYPPSLFANSEGGCDRPRAKRVKTTARSPPTLRTLLSPLRRAARHGRFHEWHLGGCRPRREEPARRGDGATVRKAARRRCAVRIAAAHARCRRRAEGARSLRRADAAIHTDRTRRAALAPPPCACADALVPHAQPPACPALPAAPAQSPMAKQEVQLRAALDEAASAVAAAKASGKVSRGAAGNTRTARRGTSRRPYASRLLPPADAGAQRARVHAPARQHG